MPGRSVSSMAWTDCLISNYWKNYGQFSNPIITWNLPKLFHVSWIVSDEVHNFLQCSAESGSNSDQCNRNPTDHQCCKSCSTKYRCPRRGFSTCNSCDQWEKICYKSAQYHQSLWKQVALVQSLMWFFVDCWLATEIGTVHSPARK